MPASPRDPEQPILVGVDAGASKTVAVAVHPDGALVGRAEGDGANPKRHGLDVASDRIAEATLRASESGGPEIPAAVGEASKGAGAGGHPLALVLVAGAGIDRPEHARALEGALAARLQGARIAVVNDTLAVLRAGTPDAVGLVVPVSTGGNVIGRARGGQVTDRGHGIFGGGYVLGALAARAGMWVTPTGATPSAGHGGSTSDAMGRGRPVSHPAGRASPSVGHVGPDLAAQVAAATLTWKGRRPGPEAARLGAAVAAAAQAGDPYPARMVARWCGRVEAAVREEAERLDLGPEPVVILYGGLLDASTWLGRRIGEAVHRGVPGARLRQLHGEPVDGAVLLVRDAWAGHPVRWDFVPRR